MKSGRRKKGDHKKEQPRNESWKKKLRITQKTHQSTPYTRARPETRLSRLLRPSIYWVDEPTTSQLLTYEKSNKNWAEKCVKNTQSVTTHKVSSTTFQQLLIHRRVRLSTLKRNVWRIVSIEIKFSAKRQEWEQKRHKDSPRSRTCLDLLEIAIIRHHRGNQDLIYYSIHYNFFCLKDSYFFIFFYRLLIPFRSVRRMVKFGRNNWRAYSSVKSRWNFFS